MIPAPVSTLLRSSGIYLGAALLNAAIPFLLMPILTRALGPEQYGIVGTFIALVNITSVIVGLSTQGIVSAVFFNERPERFGGYVSACLTIGCVTSLLLLMVFALASTPLARISKIDAGWQWTIIGAAAGQFFLAVALAVCQVRGQPIRFGVLQVINTALITILALSLVLAIGMRWEGRALGQTIAALTVGAAGFVMLYRSGDIAARPDGETVKETLRFGVALVPHGLAAALMASMDRLILTHLLGSAESGQYFVAFQLAGLITFFSNAVNQAWVPWLYKRLAAGEPAGARQIVRVSYLLFAVVIMSAGLVAIGSPFLVGIFAGDRFDQAARLLPLLAPAAALNGAYYFVTNYIFYARKTAWLSIITVSVMVVQIGLLLLLVDAYGAWGAAYATLIGAIVYFTTVFTVAQRLHPMPWLRSGRV